LTQHSYEAQQLSAGLGGSKLSPKWSEPCRIVVKFCNKDKTVVNVKSVWHRNIHRRVNINDVIKIPSTIGSEALNFAKMELLADLRKAAVHIPTEQKVK